MLFLLYLTNMKSTDTLSKVIIAYWIAVLCVVTFYSIDSFADFLSGNEDFNYRIILRAFGLIAIIYCLADLTVGLFKKVLYSLRLLKILARYSYWLGLLGLVVIIMQFSGIFKTPDAYLIGGVCGFIALSGYLSNLWIKRNYPNEAAGRIAS